MMTWVFRQIGRVLVLLLIAVAAVYVLGPTEDVTLDPQFDAAAIGADPAAYLAGQEAQVSDIIPGTQKRIIWAAEPGAATPISLLYVHGFSATSEEIRPVPDRLAADLGANLVYTRLQGHGRSAPDAMAEGTVAGWMRDLAEGLAVARATGERVIVIATSTGGTLVAGAQVVPGLMDDVAGVILVSPNFGLNTGVEPMLTLPAARYWVPLIAGQRRSFEPRNDGQAEFWTTDYPSTAVFPMAALVKAVREINYEQTSVPALFAFSAADQVVRPDITTQIMADWGGPTARFDPGEMTAADDPLAHVIAGDIMSPSKTEATVTAMRAWIEGL